MRERAFPVLCPVRVSVGGFPVGLAPSLHRILGRYPRVLRLPRYYVRVRLLGGIPSGLRLVVFPLLPATHHTRRGSSEVSRFPFRRHVLACRSLRPRLERSAQARVLRALRHGHPRKTSALAPATSPFRGSFSRPANSSPYASTRGSPHGPQGLDFPGSSSSWGRTCCFASLTCFLLPVLIGAYRFRRRRRRRRWFP